MKASPYFQKFKTHEFVFRVSENKFIMQYSKYGLVELKKTSSKLDSSSVFIILISKSISFSSMILNTLALVTPGSIAPSAGGVKTVSLL